MEQGSCEWFEARCGKVTASRVADALARTKAGWGAARATYMGQLIAERLTGEISDTFQNSAMQWGTLTEPQARAAYEFLTDRTVDLIGFVDHPEIRMSGASPDGLIGEDGLIEIKCPTTKTHIDTLLTSIIDDKYITQMMWQMACTGRAWCDFVSFDPRLPASMRTFIQRIERDDDFIGNLETDIGDFIKELDETVEKLRAKYERAAA